MFTRIYILLGAFAACCLGNPLIARQGGFCGTPALSEEAKRTARLEMATANVGASMIASVNITVPTYFHVIASSKTVAGGYLTVWRVSSQSSILS